MNIVRLKGGLGNQMFQFAFGKAMENHGKEVAFDTEFYIRNSHLRKYELDKVFGYLKLKYVDAKYYCSIEKEWELLKSNPVMLKQNINDDKKRLFYIETGHSCYQEDVWKYNNCVFVGYWQTEKYFADIKDKIREMFSFEINDEKVNQLSSYLNDEHYYGVHIRRGDFLNSQHDVCNCEYYRRAMGKVLEIDCKAKFIFFSDDMKWVKSQNLVSEKDIIQSGEEYEDYCDWYDMYLMTKCRGNVISNSSFGWWGAWLSGEDKVVVAPSKWYRQDDAPDIYCKNWLKL